MPRPADPRLTTEPRSHPRRLAVIGLLLAGFGLSGLGLGGCTVEGTALSTASSTALMAAQERGFQGAMQDTRIRFDINHLWFQASEDLFRSVRLQVQRGRVLLTGNVKDAETKIDAVRLVWQVYGVREVIDEIEINDKASLLSYGRDQFITTELESKILFDREIASINYSIVTVNQTVYLMGLSRSAAEEARVVAHAKDIAYVRGVVSYVEDANTIPEPPPPLPQSPQPPQPQSTDGRTPGGGTPAVGPRAVGPPDAGTAG